MAIFDALRTFFTPPPSFLPFEGPSPRWEEEAERALTFETIFGHDLDSVSSPQRVTSENARKNPFVWACQSIISGTIANLPSDVVRKQGDVRLPVENPPDWVEAPNPLNPNFTSISYKRQVVLSLLQDGNAFVAVAPDVLDPARLLVLNPAQVEIVDGDDMPLYIVRGQDGRRELARLTPFNCLHMPFILPPGYTRGLNPVEAAALTIGVDLAAQKQASKFVSGGGLVTGVIESPLEMTQEQMDGLREGFKRRREGPSGYSIGVLQGGATFKPISQSAAESDYIAGRKLSREEIAGMYLVPAFMIGSQEPGGVAYASAVERAQHFIDYCLIHYSGPIEKGHNRLLPGGEFYRLNYNALLRGDMKTRVGIYDTLLQDRVVKVDQVRELEDWAPFGEGAGGGFLETPNNSGIPQAQPAQTPAPGRAVDIHLNADTLRMDPAPAPIVHVPAAVVQVEPPDLTQISDAVREQQEALETDAVMTRELLTKLVEQTKPRKVQRMLTYDQAGKLTGSIEEPI